MKDRVRNALLVPAAFLLALVAAWAPPQHSKAARVVAGHATPTPSAADWKEIDRLVEQQKLAEASAKADAILQRAIRAKNEDEWTRALVRCVQLRSGLHGYETAVRFLKEQPWPTWSKGHEMTPHALARLLASFDVLSSQHWVAGRKVRGYRRVTFDDLFPRYLPVKASTRENSNNDGGESTNSDRYEPESPTASPSGENPMDAGNSPVSSVWNPLRAPTAQPHAFHAEPPTKGGRNGQPVTDHPSDHDHQEPHHTNEGE